MWNLCSVYTHVLAYMTSQKMVIQGITGSLALFFAKLSLFLLFLRLFSPNRKLKCGVYLGITFSAAFSLTSVLVTGILCSPRPGQPWDDLRVIFRCSTERYFALIQGVLNMLLDFYILYLPIPVLWKLQLPVRKRMGVIGVFMTGSMWVLLRTLQVYIDLLDANCKAVLALRAC